jgi:hypothetical protein
LGVATLPPAILPVEWVISEVVFFPHDVSELIYQNSG